MGQARLTRIDALQEMAAAVDAFRNEAITALEDLDMEIRRAVQWIHHDRREHWNHAVRRGWDQLTEARLQLQQARTARRIGEHDPACIDEKKALARAQRRLEIAQEKIEAVRHCTRAIDHAVDEYRGVRTQLSCWLESEAPKALAALQRMMDNLEEYLALHAPGGGSAGGSGEQGAGSGGELHAPGSLLPVPCPLPPAPDGTAVNPDTNSPAKPAGGAP